MTETTDSDGHIMFNLAEVDSTVKESGTYYVKEISSPTHY